LSGTRRPSSGRVRLGERPIDHLSRREVAQQIAVVPQETELAFEYSVIEIVLMGRHPHLGLFTVEGPDDIRIAQDALAATGTAHLAERPFHHLSGGEKQRVVIAAALAQSAQLLLLDEPTASLDLGYQLEVSALLKRLNQDHGVTMAISTHDLNLAAAICRELILMRDGRVIATGPTNDVLTPENVRLVYDVEADVHVHGDTGHMTVVPVRRIGP
jgi:iron complex transport system ATP-binding protein